MGYRGCSHCINSGTDCPSCRGTGKDRSNPKQRCSKCSGTGKCPKCKGRGVVYDSDF